MNTWISRFVALALLLASVQPSAKADIFSILIPVDPDYSEINSVSIVAHGNIQPNGFTSFHNPFPDAQTFLTFPDPTETIYTYHSFSGGSITPTGSGFTLPIGLDTGSSLISIPLKDMYYTGTKGGLTDISTHVPVFSLDFADPSLRGDTSTVAVLFNVVTVEYLVLGTYLSLSLNQGLAALASNQTQQPIVLTDLGTHTQSGPINPADWIDPNNPAVNIPTTNIPGGPLTMQPGATYNVSVVPEPGTYAFLLGLVVPGVMLYRRRRA